MRNNIFNDLKNQKLNVNSANLQFDCCYEDISRVKNIISNNNNDSVIAAGGGKVLDSGKYIAESLNIPCITVPLAPLHVQVGQPYQYLYKGWSIYKGCCIRILSENTSL